MPTLRSVSLPKAAKRSNEGSGGGHTPGEITSPCLPHIVPSHKLSYSIQFIHPGCCLYRFIYPFLLALRKLSLFLRTFLFGCTAVLFGFCLFISLQRFPKFYFCVVLAFYELGLLTTGLVMLYAQHPQPALLYLVPYCLFSLFGAAALNGKVKEV